jgi:hypothetical protein
VSYDISYNAIELTVSISGLNRGSFAVGESTPYQRIERLWRDVRNGVERCLFEWFPDRQEPL